MFKKILNSDKCFCVFFHRAKATVNSVAIVTGPRLMIFSCNIYQTWYFCAIEYVVLIYHWIWHSTGFISVVVFVHVFIVLSIVSLDAVSSEKQHDAGIFVLTILLCSQLIYNSLNVPYKRDLDKLE